MPATPQSIGFAVALRLATFPSPSETPVGRPSPVPLQYGFMRSGFLSSSKSLRRFSRSPLVRATTPAGVSSLFATSPTASTPSRAPHRSLSTPVQLTGSPTFPASFRPQVFSTSRRLAPPSDSRACFIPQPRAGLPFRSGVSPDAQRYPTHRRALPPYRCCAPTGRRPGRRERASRLRGFIPYTEAFLRVRV